ncbi:MAG: hypothetical protein ACKPH7_23375 [Planktothrix sp.]|uniref:hypothetical protein n=1 Tax=Planktothrix sp. TaxID=3088171 RepID=UPI0038D49EBE
MGLAQDSSTVFEIFDSTLAETAPELLGLWVTKPTAPNLAFSINSGTLDDVPLWRANFPSDLRKADQLLVKSEGKLDQSQQALDTVIERINWLLTRPESKIDWGLAFDISSNGKEFSQPEQELLTSLQELQEIQPRSFSLSQPRVDIWKQGFEQFRSLLKRSLEVIANYAKVETQWQGQTLAQTVVSWTGDVKSIWINGIQSEQINLHERTLALALASRNTLLQTFSTAIQVALKLSVVLSLPGGFILALPATWKFINQVIAR